MTRIVLKLGGSVITDKETPESLDETAIEEAASTIAAQHPSELLLVHGGGSFGHPVADRFGLDQATGTRDVTEITTIHDAMRRLSQAVLEALQGEGISALPIAPLSSCHRRSDSHLSIPHDLLGEMLAQNFTPIMHGDVIIHEDRGATILSGDELTVALASRLQADRVGVCTGVPGVLDGDGNVIDRIDDPGDFGGIVGDSDVTDVTGGMAAKVDALGALEAEASVFGLEALAAFLTGESPGTTIG